MDSFRPQKSPGSDRFLGLYSSSPPSSSSSPFELDEHDIFSTDTDTAFANPNLTTRKSPNLGKSPLSPFHAERNFGILAALPEESNHDSPKFLQRKPSFSATSSSASTSPSPSSARMIPVVPKPRPERLGQHQYQSAPVNVPVVPARLRMRSDYLDEEEDEDENDEMMLPPHEIVDRAQGKGEPVTTFSVLEGVGRTLKGRDLRRVRNAVWHQTDIIMCGQIRVKYRDSHDTLNEYRHRVKKLFGLIPGFIDI